MTGNLPAQRPRRRRRPARRRATPSRTPYGTEYAAAAKALKATFRDGQLCPYPDCPYPGRRMRYWHKIDAGHVIPRMLGGGIGTPLLRLEHASCNRRHGARMGNLARSKRAQVAGMKRAVEKKARQGKW